MKPNVSKSEFLNLSNTNPQIGTGLNPGAVVGSGAGMRVTSLGGPGDLVNGLVK